MRDQAVVDEKRAMRRAMKATLSALDPALHTVAGRAVADFVDAILAQARPGPVALFASLAHEIDTTPVDEAVRGRGRVRLLPIIKDGALAFAAVPDEVRLDALPCDAMGIRTPTDAHRQVALAEAALVLVPGCAFDDDGHRLGWGKGYYDGALRALPGDIPTVALLHDVQRVARVPRDALDVPVQVTLSPSAARVHAPLPAPLQSAIHAAFLRRGGPR